MIHGTMDDDLLVLFPGALGDFICLRPSLLSLRGRTRGRVTVAAHPSLFSLLPAADFGHLSIDRHEIADLFAEGPLRSETQACLAGFSRTLSWTGFGNLAFARRLADATEGQVIVHPFRAMRPDEHAVDYYARCAGVQPIISEFRPSQDADRWAADFWDSHGLGNCTLAMHSGSGSEAKNWRGMAEIATWWRLRPGARVLSLRGPVELERQIELPADAEARDEPLDRVAALLRRSRVYLGNDSGVSHLAGLAGARTIALFGSSEPRNWRPLGSVVQVLHRPQSCARCGPEAFCTHRLRVDQVGDAIDELCAASP
jgi:ADP-heptose:LPS heptosyltransferase